MLAVKIHQERGARDADFDRTIENISSHICNKLNLNEVKVLSDNYCIEIVSGKDTPSGNDEIVAELVIRKTIVINKDDIGDKESLDRFVTNIKHFCDQAKEIEESAYFPVHMR